MKYPLKVDALVEAYEKLYGEASDVAKELFVECVKAINQAFEAGLKEGQANRWQGGNLQS